MTPGSNSSDTGSGLVDFSDVIGPMVVKELRQGLRTRAFTWAFLFVQGFLLLFMMSGFSESSDGRDTAGSFWGLLQFALLIVMPFRGLNALNSEVRLNTMELITLTRMSAWRITYGKWLALVSQSLLLAVAVLPYIVLRYFFGGMNVLAELVTLAVVLGLSALLTALMVGLSVVSNFLIRCFFTVPVLIVVMRFMGEAIYRVSRGDGIAPFNLGLLSWCGIVPAAVFLGYYLLDMAASRIAPQAINYVTRRRLIGFAVFLCSVVVAHIVGGPGFLFFPFFFFMLLGLDALSEHPATVSSVYVPFRRRAWTRPFEYLLAPGWFSGSWFVLLLGGILLAGALLFPNVWEAAGLGSDVKAAGLVLGFVASALLPLAVMLIPRHGNPQPIVSYCLITIFMGTVSSTMIPFVDQGDIPALAWLGMILPPVATYAMLNDSLAMEEVTFVAGITVVVAILSLAVVRWKWGKIRRSMEQARREDFVA
jgi:hypothetical protein